MSGEREGWGRNLFLFPELHFVLQKGITPQKNTAARHHSFSFPLERAFTCDAEQNTYRKEQRGGESERGLKFNLLLIFCTHSVILSLPVL